MIIILPQVHKIQKGNVKIIAFIANMEINTRKKGVQNGFYTARYGLKGCHRAVRTVPATQNREKAAPQARSKSKGHKNSKNLSINIENLSKIIKIINKL